MYIRNVIFVGSCKANTQNHIKSYHPLEANHIDAGHQKLSAILTPQNYIDLILNLDSIC